MAVAAVWQNANRNGVPCVILRAMSDNADESGYEVLVVKQFSIGEYVKTATEIVARMIESVWFDVRRSVGANIVRPRADMESAPTEFACHFPYARRGRFYIGPLYLRLPRR